MPRPLTPTPRRPVAKMSAPPESQVTRYLAWLFAPTSERALLEALLAIEREVTQSLTVDHQVAHIRLQWWRTELERLPQGGSGEHPSTRALTRILHREPSRDDAPLGKLTGLVDNTAWDLARATFENRAELTEYCERWSGALFVPLAWNDSPVGHEADWLAVGTAVRELEVLIDLAREARSGRLRLPLDELERVGADPDVLAKPPWPDQVADLIRQRHVSLREAVRNQLQNVPASARTRIRGLWVWASLACRQSSRAEHALPDTLMARRRDLLGDVWCAWRAARGDRGALT